MLYTSGIFIFTVVYELLEMNEPHHHYGKISHEYIRNIMYIKIRRK